MKRLPEKQNRSGRLGKGKVPVKDIKAVPGPAVTLYKVCPERGVRISKVRTLMEDMALDLHLKGVRVVTLEDSIGIEIANNHRASVPIRSVLSDDAFEQQGGTPGGHRTDIRERNRGL